VITSFVPGLVGTYSGPGAFVKPLRLIELQAVSKRNVTCLLLIEVFLAAAAITQAQSGPEVTAVIARASGTNLTLGDLQKEEGGKILQAGYQYYLKERKALEELIDNRLLADEAKRKAIPPDLLGVRARVPIRIDPSKVSPVGGRKRKTEKGL
jgi:hypothetical protein